jgi:hypothetical protein
MFAFLSCFYNTSIHIIRPGSTGVPWVQYVVWISRIAVVASDGVNMLFLFVRRILVDDLVISPGKRHFGRSQ